MEIDFDKNADALYFRMQHGDVERTVKLDDRLIVDLDPNGQILGIEMLDASNSLESVELQALLSGAATSVPLKVVGD